MLHDEPDVSLLPSVIRDLEEAGVFSRAGGQLKLLKFLAEHHVEGDALKETYIGAVLYQREAAYDPRYDSTVRVNANRLRRKLEEYYAGDGKDQLRRIVLPAGSYGLRIEVIEAIEEASVPVPVPMPLEPAPGVATTPIPEPSAVPHERSAAVPARWGWWGPRLTAGAFALLLLAGMAVLWWQHAPAFVTASLITSPLTPAQRMEAAPAVSRDGHMLAYVSRVPGSSQFQIFLRKFEDVTAFGEPLDTGEGDALSPSWSPDGRSLAFTRCLRSSCELDSIAATGGAVRALHAFPGQNLDHEQLFYDSKSRRAVWTLDGKYVIFPAQTRAPERVSLVRRDLQTGTEVPLTTGIQTDMDVSAALAPDGRTLAFVRASSAGYGVHILDLETLREKSLGQKWPFPIIGVTWSPDGTGVVTSRKGDGDQWGIWWLPLHGPTRKLALNIPAPMYPVFAPDGTLMVLDTHRSQHLVVQNGFAPNATSTLLMTTTHRDIFSAFSPDGRQLAFLSDRSGQREIWLATMAGSVATGARQLTHHLPMTEDIQWSPDGSTILSGASGALYLTRASDGKIQTLRPAGLEDSTFTSATFSEDGQSIFVAAFGNHAGVFRVATAGGSPAKKMSSTEADKVRLGADHYLYFDAVPHPGIFRCSVTAQNPVTERVTAFDAVVPYSWTVENGSLYYMDSAAGTRTIHRYDLASGKSEIISAQIADAAHEASMTVSSAKQQIVYSQYDESSSYIRAVRADAVPR